MAGRQNPGSTNQRRCFKVAREAKSGPAFQNRYRSRPVTNARLHRTIQQEEFGLKKIGVLFGLENTFPGALVERINAKNIDGIVAEFVQAGAVAMNKPPAYAVIIDRISHDIPFYRAYLKHAALWGSAIINNPFWWSADDKFFNYSLAAKLGIAVPPTVMLPHKQLPNGASDRTMRNLEYPLNWDAAFHYVGFPAFLKPIDGGGWRDVHEVHSRDDFFRVYDQSGDLCMVLQRAVKFTEYFRCFVVGREKVRIMAYDPRRPYHERYSHQQPASNRRLLKRVKADALTLCRALGYDLNTVEFAVQDGVPYAIDFMNPVPDADLQSVGAESFEWIVKAMANFAVKKARAVPQAQALRSEAFLKGPSGTKARVARPKQTAAKKGPVHAALAKSEN
jgi:glutathione synthase/RimK-type ligase-like ATP-grasp enzyme